MIRKKRIFAIVPVLAALICGLFAQVSAAELKLDETPYVANVYNERNGLPTGEANTVVQTQDGYIWIGSYGGLIRYDGTTFYNYSTEDILPSSSVRALYEDSQGRLWIGTNDAGVFYLEKGELHAVENPDPKTYQCVRGFDEGEDGVIYLASNSGMGEIRDDVLIAYTGDDIAAHTVYSVSVDSYGRVWGALDSGLCAVVKDGQVLRVFSSDELFDGLEIYCTAATRNGRIYLGTSGDEIALLSFPTESLEPNDIDIEYMETPHVTTHNSIVVTDSGWVIICGNVGACVFSPEGIEHPISAEEGASAVNSGCVDYEGNIWLASTSSGILKYTRGYFNSPNKEAGLQDVAINAIVRQNGSSYIGTNTGLLIFDKNWQAVDNELTQLLAGARIRSLLVDSQGRIWVACYVNQDPIICYNPADNSMKIYTTDDGLVNSSARSLLELSDGSIAVGTQGGLSIIRNDQVVKGFTAEDGLTVSSILCILEGHDGSLLLGSDGGGIYEIKGDTIVNYSDEDGLNDGVILRMMKDQGESGYFISAGSSLYYWDENGFRKLPVQKGAGSIFDFSIHDGMVWILQNSGFLAFDRTALLAGENPIPQQFSFAHGLTGSIDANTWHWQDEDGTLYLSTRSGISIFGFETVTGTLPKGIISGVQMDDTFYSFPESIDVDKEVNRVTIDFAVLSFTETYDVGFTCMLEGFDEEETLVTGEKSGSISYTNLPAGEYTFRLRIFLLDHPNLSNDYTLTITKDPKLLELVWVQILLIVLLIAVVAFIVAMIYRAKIRSIQKRQQGYHSVIEQLLKAFSRSIDARDSYADGHSMRVAEYARELARRMGKSEDEQENIYCAALLHDIGKISVSDEFLNDAEVHSKVGSDMLKGVTVLKGASDAAKYHHDRYDGKDYHEKLSGTDIPLIARIIAVANTYDIMSCDSDEHKALSNAEIADALQRSSGSLFDPEIVPHMLAMINEGIVPVSPEANEESSEK